MTGFALRMAATYVPFFYIQTYALRLGIDEDMGFNLLSIMNAASAFGALIWRPVAGACLRPSGDPYSSMSDIQREYQGTWIFAAGLLLAVFGILTWSRHLKVSISWGRV